MGERYANGQIISEVRDGDSHLVSKGWVNAALFTQAPP